MLVDLLKEDHDDSCKQLGLFITVAKENSVAIGTFLISMLKFVYSVQLYDAVGFMCDIGLAYIQDCGMNLQLR